MTEREQTPETHRKLKPELVKYEDGEYAIELTKPGTEVDFSALGKQDRVSKAFDVESGVGTMVALHCVDYDGNRSVFVGGTAFDDLVCKLDEADGRWTFGVFEDPDFNTLLASGPMTVGARHNRLGERKLTKVSALPQTGIIEGSEDRVAPNGISSPLSVATRLFLQKLDSPS